MNNFRITTLSVLAAAAMAACSSMPTESPALQQARSDYQTARANPQTETLAPVEMKQAGDALAQAEAAFVRRDDRAQIDQLAYLSQQRTAVARETASRKGSEAAVAAAGAERDRMRLAARTREADAATANAAAANRDAASSQRQSEASQRQAAASQRDAAAAAQQTVAAQQQAALSQQQASEAERRSQALEAQMREMNAKKTERGMVITIGDVLFDSGQAQLKPGSLQGMQRLSGFLKQYPQRKALIEGYTDSVGSESMNISLSGRRADAVMAALLGMGVDRSQLAAQGYGETYPVAGNDTQSGRQMNRRVEVVLSDESGALKPR